MNSGALIFLFLLFVLPAMAQDEFIPSFQKSEVFKQLPQGQGKRSSDEDGTAFIQGKESVKLKDKEMTSDDDKSETVFVPTHKDIGMKIKDDGKDKKKDSFVMGSGEKIDTKEDADDFLESFSGYVPEQKVEANFSTKLSSVKNFSRSGFSILYYKDNFQYASPGKSFNRIFRDSPNSVSPFFVQLGGNRIFSKGWGQLGLGFKFAIGYMNGRGYFKNNDGTLESTPSDVRMLFWTVPLDFAISMEFPLFNMFKAGGAFGPSGILVMQNRSDGDNIQTKRTIRRFGYGYFIEGNFKIELLRWFSDEYARKVFQQYSMTNTFITISLRKVYYNNFSDAQSKFPRDKKLKIEGESIGVGLAYEFF